MRPIILLAAILIVSTTSCKKENNPKTTDPAKDPKTGYRMTTWESDNWGYRISYHFEYNNEGKLSKFTKVLPPLDTSSTQRIITHTFQYGAGGRIETEQNHSPGGKILYGHYNYTNDGHLERFEYKNDTGLVELRLEYKYSGNVMDMRITHAPNGGITNYKFYKDSVGNINEIWCQSGINPNYRLSLSGTTYDDNPNIFSTIPGMECFYMLTSPDEFSGIITKSNVLTNKVHTNTGTVYSYKTSYEYNSDSVVVKRLSEDGMSLDVFSYERY